MLAGLRHGRTLGTPLALVVRNDDHKNWTWGMSPWPPEGEPAGKGTKPVTLPRPGHADLAGVHKFGHDDVRNALERASARHTAVHVAAGAVAKALLARSGSRSRDDRRRGRVARAHRRGAGASATPSAALVEVRATGVPPGLGSYAAKEDRLDARLAAAVMGIQAVKGVEIGDGFALASLRGSQAHDEIGTARRRTSNRAGGIEAGVSNGEEIVVRAAMKPLPTLMKPLASVDLATGEEATALVERSDVAAVEALAVVAEAAVAWELAVAAQGQVRRRRASATSSPRIVRTASASNGTERARPASGAGRLHGRGEDDAWPARCRSRLGRPVVDIDKEIEARYRDTIPHIFEEYGEPRFRRVEAYAVGAAVERRHPTILDLGGGAVDVPRHP